MAGTERVASTAGSVSGAASVLGSWQVCHNVCLGLIAALGIFGITITGMPLLFLTRIALPMWLLAVVLLAVVIAMYAWKRCIPAWLLLVNAGLVTAGAPVSAGFTFITWTMGGLLVGGGAVAWFRRRSCCSA